MVVIDHSKDITIGSRWRYLSIYVAGPCVVTVRHIAVSSEEAGSMIVFETDEGTWGTCEATKWFDMAMTRAGETGPRFTRIEPYEINFDKGRKARRLNLPDSSSTCAPKEAGCPAATDPANSGWWAGWRHENALMANEAIVRQRFSLPPVLREYICHKKVKAAKIGGIVRTLDGKDIFRRLLLNDGKDTTLVTKEWCDKHTPAPGGYYVVYADGYTSYSPAKAFENGYILTSDAAAPSQPGVEAEARPTGGEVSPGNAHMVVEGVVGRLPLPEGVAMKAETIAAIFQMPNQELYLQFTNGETVEITEAWKQRNQPRVGGHYVYIKPDEAVFIPATDDSNRQPIDPGSVAAVTIAGKTGEYIGVKTDSKPAAKIRKPRKGRKA